MMVVVILIIGNVGLMNRMKTKRIFMYLADNVYFIKGASCSAIYDLNKCFLYHLNNESTIFLDKFLNSEIQSPSKDELKFIEKMSKNKILVDYYVQKHDIRELKPSPKIEFVWIEVTKQCNLKCRHCYNESSPNHSEIMPYHKFCYVVDELVQYGIKKIQLIGGEPFCLNKSLIKYLDYCINKFQFIEVFTNGTLVNDTDIEYFKKNNINVALSIYSYISSEHDAVTGCVGSFNKTKQTISKLNKEGIKYRAKNVLMKGIKIGEKNTELFTLSNKHDIVRLTGRADFSLLDDDLIEKKLITEKNFKKQFKKTDVIRSICINKCFATRLYISTNLDVYPCVMERRIKHGNLLNNSLLNVLNKEIFEISKDKISGCKNCEFRYLCQDCRPNSLSGDLYEKPWFCTYDEENGIWISPKEYILALKNLKFLDKCLD